jgi:serine/threonine protein kinase
MRAHMRSSSSWRVKSALGEPPASSPPSVVRSFGVALEPIHLADFLIGDPLGSGATSRVFAATHKSTNRQVAIKMLEPSHRDSAELRTRMQREAIMLSGVESPHVGRILGFGYEDEQPFLCLERLHGETLADLLKRNGRIEIDKLVTSIEQLLVGVRDCHHGGVIHRDIKPANIFLDESEGGHTDVKLIDFGVARLKEIAQAGRSLTSTHHLLGSMGYMAPEQFQNAKRVGPQADVYAIGVVIFRCVTGRLPFVSKSFETLIKMKLEKPSPRMSTMPGVGKNDLLDAFVQTALQPNASSRFDDGKQMLEAWWRVAADLDRDSLFLDGVDVVFEFEDDIEVSTDVVAGGAVMMGKTMAEIESTTVSRHRGNTGSGEQASVGSGATEGDESDDTDATGRNGTSGGT